MEHYKKYTVIVNRLKEFGDSQIVVINHATGKPTIWQRIITKDRDSVPTLSPSLRNTLWQLCLDEKECNILLCEDGEVISSNPLVETRPYRYPSSKQMRN